MIVVADGEGRRKLLARRRRTGRSPEVLRCVVALLVAAAALAACGAGQGSTGATPSGTALEFNEADVLFARTMIPHGEQGADMSTRVLTEQGVEPGVRALATELVATRDVETEQLQQWVAARGEPLAAEAQHDHGGGEDGIATPDRMLALDEAVGPAAQSLYVEMMIKHHRGAVVAAREEIAHGQSATLVEFARMVLRTREAQLAVLENTTGPVVSASPPTEDESPR